MLKEWPNWIKKVLAYSTMESKTRVAIKELLKLKKHSDDKARFQSLEGISIISHPIPLKDYYITTFHCGSLIWLCSDCDGVYTIFLLSTLLFGKRGSTLKLIYEYQVSIVSTVQVCMCMCMAGIYCVFSALTYSLVVFAILIPNSNSHGHQLSNTTLWCHIAL